MAQPTDPIAKAIDGQTLSAGIQRLINIERPRFRRLWAYYRNPMRAWAIGAGDQGSEKPYRQAQEWGLPSRITAMRAGSEIWNINVRPGVARKEIVIENDIGWRVDTMVDYLFGKPVTIDSAVSEPKRRDAITRLLRLVLAKNGGVMFFQQLALLGAIYGFVDVLVKLEPGNGGSGSVPTGLDGAKPSRKEGRDGARPSKKDGRDGARSSRAGGDRAARGQSAGWDGAVPETADALPLPLAVDPSRPETAMDGEAGNEATAIADAMDLGFAASTDQPIANATDATETLDDDAGSEWSDARLAQIAAMIRLEIVEPAASVPFLSSCDYRIIEAYAQVGQRRLDPSRPQPSSRGIVQRLRESTVGKWLGYSANLDSVRTSAVGTVTLVDVITPTRWQRYEDDTLVAEGENSLGVVPVVHIQNIAMPFEYSGAGDVEPLIPLQDELNTRLSDRAHRISMQSFKIYLAKGIDGFTSMPVGPGKMWMTDNEKASVEEFGGDASSPSEDSHISDIRDAFDKISGVTPVAAGAIKNKVGRLTSAAALRITLLSLLARTDKKRTSYGVAIGRICELSLMWLDRAGVFPTNADERRVELSWPSPLPDSELETLQAAQAKLRVGVPQEIVLKELGYTHINLTTTESTTGARDASANNGGRHGSGTGQSGTTSGTSGKGGASDAIGGSAISAADVANTIG